jgi:hypothetical protein
LPLAAKTVIPPGIADSRAWHSNALSVFESIGHIVKIALAIAVLVIRYGPTRFSYNENPKDTDLLP